MEKNKNKKTALLSMLILIGLIINSINLQYFKYEFIFIIGFALIIIGAINFGKCVYIYIKD